LDIWYISALIGAINPSPTHQSPEILFCTPYILELGMPKQFIGLFWLGGPLAGNLRLSAKRDADFDAFAWGPNRNDCAASGGLCLRRIDEQLGTTKADTGRFDHSHRSVDARDFIHSADLGSGLILPAVEHRSEWT
jgi:hypothetical protein